MLGYACEAASKGHEAPAGIPAGPGCAQVNLGQVCEMFRSTDECIEFANRLGYTRMDPVRGLTPSSCKAKLKHDS